MKIKLALIGLLVVFGVSGVLIAQHFHKPEASPYAGQQSRDIKSLSDDDIAELRRGGGWGLAKAAELNGVPGPAHLLEMKDKIALSPEQVEKITAVFDEMQTSAKTLGVQLIDSERQLEEQFRNGTVSEESLQTMLAKISDIRSRLRYAHLAAHLETPKIVSSDQIEQYNSLRGYGAGDPCENIPEGHNAAMWKKHNGCS